MNNENVRGELEEGWIGSAFAKCRAGVSNVVVFQTTDLTRVGQIIAFLMRASADAKPTIYQYDPWTGLERLARDTWDPVTEKQVTEYRTIDKPPPSFEDALRVMDEKLRRERSALVIRHVDPIHEGTRERELIHAVRSWSQDLAIRAAGSVVAISCADAASLFDGSTLQSVAVRTPPIGAAPERAYVIDVVAREFGIDPGRSLDELVLVTAGLNLHELRGALADSYHRTGKFDLEALKQAKSDVIARSKALAIEEPDPHGFARIGGYEAVKRLVRERIVKKVRQPGDAKNLATKLPGGILLYGPPGVGKTVFAKALARETNLQFIRFEPENLFHHYFGASGRNFQEAIRVVEQMAPCIIFWDEIDSIGRRSANDGADSAGQENRRVLDQILKWLGSEDRRSILVGTTNRPDDLDEALTRPGRFDFKVPFLYPNEEARLQILEVHLGLTDAKPRPPTEINGLELKIFLRTIAERTAYFTGAELEQLVNFAKDNAFVRDANAIVENDFEKALADIRIDPERPEKFKQYLEEAEKHINDRSFLEELRNEK